ncbi:MAG: type II toxin-antitoxin system Phd/YefM family antitoxin [Propionibacteriales bacterium]|nr:type II toxin-antitoxin system Phd/YefM family antitoxin [Propionibacteriales bacterium]
MHWSGWFSFPPTHERVHVTRNGREYVVLMMSAQDLESLEATIELLSDDAAMRRLREAEQDVADGDVTTLDEMGQLMQARNSERRET